MTDRHLNDRWRSILRYQICDERNTDGVNVPNWASIFVEERKVYVIVSQLSFPLFVVNDLAMPQ